MTFRVTKPPSTRPGRILAFLLLRNDFPLTQLDLRFEGGFGLLFGSELGIGDGVKGVAGGEGGLELEGWDSLCCPLY